MNTHSAFEYTNFAPAQLLRILHEHRPNNKGDTDLRVNEEDGRIYYMEVGLVLN
jgi:hypothetical protein